MKIIISRKGFDGGNAGMPSPIMPDGTPLSLPIPRRRGHSDSYDDLYFGERSLSSIIRDLRNLSGVALPFIDEAHADPDLEFYRLRRLCRKEDWRPAFGQTGGDQTHLENQGVGVGDLFLFFGWFRHTEKADDGRLRYVRRESGFHALFGWLQVGSIHHVNGRTVEGLPDWLRQHPHAATPDAFDANNTIYVSSEHLQLGVSSLPDPGGGTFRKLHPALRLTKPGEKRCSYWALPNWFFPGTTRPPLSYHGDLSRWSKDGDQVILRSVAKGQEFVLDTEFYPEAHDWMASLFGIGEKRAEYRPACRNSQLVISEKT